MEFLSGYNEIKKTNPKFPIFIIFQGKCFIFQPKNQEIRQFYNFLPKK
jgi:hypothetical protein